jgi:6-phosphogluconolactonase
VIQSVRNISLTLLAASATIPALHAYEPAAAPSAERVYVMTNNASKNEVLAFERKDNGRFHSIGRYETGGRGSGGTTDPLESQGALSFNQDHSLLFAVNAGSGTVSSFFVAGNNLVLADQEPTVGAEPVSVAQGGGFVYVLNQGGFGGVTVFRVDAAGHLKRIPKSTTLLSATGAGAASVAGSPDGRFLAVTERLTNNIDTFRIFPDGTLSPITTTLSKNPGAFSAIFSQAGQLLVSETGPATTTNTSTFSSYGIHGNAAITPISSAVPTYATGNCWAALTPDGKRAYVSNSGSDSISGFNVAPSGALTPIGNTIVGTLPPGSHNVDIAVSADGKFVYTQNSDSGTIGVFSIQADGMLQEDESVSGLADQAGFNGLAAY